MSKRINSIRITHHMDTDADTSFIGEYTDDHSEWNIDRNEGEYIAVLEQQDEEYEAPERGREYRFFAPYAGGEKAGTDDYQKYGKQDFERMESLNNGGWYFIGIDATAEVVVNGTIQRIRSGGLWGIESDSGADYLKLVAQEQLAELADQLKELGFTAKQIKAIEPEQVEA